MPSLRKTAFFNTRSLRWPRRGHTLLDIGCGAGIFLEMLWHYGFDVTGLDTGTDLLDMARERLGNRAEFQLGRPEHLPFDDEEFDYAALLTVLEYVDNPEDVLREAIGSFPSRRHHRFYEQFFALSDTKAPAPSHP